MIESFASIINGFLLMLRIYPGDRFPRALTHETENALLERSYAGDIDARNELIEHNLRLVAHIIKKYYTKNEDADDLISIGTIGLIKGINTYRADKGVRLATYLSRCIENELLMHFRGKKKSANDISLSDVLDHDDSGDSLELIDVICDESSVSERIERRERTSRINHYIEALLSPREALIIRTRYGLGGTPPLTQKETADLCGISRSYVSRIEKHALEKLRDALTKDDII